MQEIADILWTELVCVCYWAFFFLLGSVLASFCWKSGSGEFPPLSLFCFFIFIDLCNVLVAIAKARGAKL